MGTKVVCGKCGGTFEARGFKVHETFCKGVKTENHKKIDSETSIEKCHVCGSNDILRLDKLSNRRPDAVKHFVKMGYTHVCNDCWEVLK